MGRCASVGWLGIDVYACRQPVAGPAYQLLQSPTHSPSTIHNTPTQGSVSSTDIKLPDSTSSCCEGDTTLHAGAGVKPSPQAATTTTTAAAMIADSEQRRQQQAPDESDDGDDSLVLPNNKTPRTAHAAVRRWFVGRVFGGDGAGAGGDGAGEVEEKEESVWV